MNAAIELFISYSHRDEALQRELMKFLKPLERDGLVRCWCDARIEAGQAFDDEIARHLDKADIILLLVSIDFLASDYCYSVEMERAIARHEAGEARVIPIILRHVDWQSAPFGKLKAVPKDGRPVMAWTDKDEAFWDVSREIRRAIDSVSERKVRLTGPTRERASSAVDIRTAQGRPLKFEGDWLVESCDSEDGNPVPGTRAELTLHQGQYSLRFLDTHYEWKLRRSGNALLGGGMAQQSVISILLLLADDDNFITFSVTGPNINKQGILRRL